MTSSRNKPKSDSAAVANTEPVAETSTPAQPGAALVPPARVADATVVEAGIAMEQARVALAAAEAEFAAAEFVAERAQLEDQKRRDRAEDERIGRLGQDVPKLRAAVEFDLNQFRIAVAGLRDMRGSTMDQVTRAWMQMSHSREVLRRVLAQITAHTSKRSDESYQYWDRKVAEWVDLLRGALDLRPHGIGSLSQAIFMDATKDPTGGAATFLEALAKVNETITEQSQDAPVPLNRRPDDISAPGPTSLGVFSGSEIMLRNPIFRERPMPRDFSRDLDEALTHAVQAEVDVYMPNISPLPLGGIDVTTARRLAAGAAARIRKLSPREDVPGAELADVTPADQ